ncbi:HAD-IA family hydrolase [Bacillus sp. FJAT-50079]|uniref:HAD-IA family hydrolase n=1 Tax=Bacillus sp. FJAT-50079 TaxID=2833577 RepID=UPI001BC9DE58|nr:HAD-IA family hydrolase [Bacillus sp. FJAT-50079]MBS4208218.1 HAD-IA family hydrolase [Bacillus sp. FJAT-50079]
MIKAVLFDQDGVIIDTERDGHRVAFNMAFTEHGYDIEWDVELYHKLLQIGGGKERIRYYFENYYEGATPRNIDELIHNLHKTKTEAFLEILNTLPLRPGIKRFMKELNEAGILIGICTTSNEKVANTIANSRLAGIEFSVILAGDMVSKKKPDPEIYNTALKKINITPSECLVVEDSYIGISAAKAAGCHVLATYSDYTKDEDLSQADMIVNCLGDENGEKACFIKSELPLLIEGVITFKDLQLFLSDELKTINK